MQSKWTRTVNLLFRSYSGEGNISSPHPLPKRNNSTRKKWGPISSTQTYFCFLPNTNSYMMKLDCIQLRDTRGSAAVFEGGKNAFFSVFISFFFLTFLGWQKKEWSHFIPIQSSAREKWFRLNRTTVLLCSVLLDASAGLRDAGSRATFVAFGSAPTFS